MTKLIKLNIPLSSSSVVKLKVGDLVLLSGTIYTARDAAHKYLVEEATPAALPFSLEGGALYHCGPIVKKIDKGYQIIAAGPTTSNREEPYEATVIKKYGIKAIIGKGGMGEATLKALWQNKAVYLSAIGGIAQVLRKSIKKVANVYLLERFGVPEAFWEMRVKDFPAIVTMDAHGNSLHKEVEKKSLENFKKLKI